MALIRVNHHPAPRQLLLFAAAWVILAGAVGGFQWNAERETLAQVCWGAALAVPVVGVVWREGLRLFYIGLTYAVFPIGWVVSTVVLVVLYFGVLTPIGFLLRVRRHDPLQQTPASRADSYWHLRAARRSASGYFRQH